ncbi:unnamed protein product, partial [Scytosiphon promiscuus]
MAIAAEHNMNVLQLDVQTSYLERPVEDNVYVNPAPGYGSQGKVMKLNKSLLGLRQSGNNWFTIDHLLADIGFVPNRSDPCVYVYIFEDSKVM